MMKHPKTVVFLVLAVVVVFLVIFFASRELSFSLEDKTDTYTIAITIPKTGNEALDVSLQKYAEFLKAEFSEMYGPGQFTPEEYDLLGFSDGRRYELTVNGEAWEHGPISGVVLDRYTFTGGAHGATDFIPFAYDADGTPIGLDALFVPGSHYLERIAEYIGPVLKEKLEQDDAYLENMFSVGVKPDPGNYMVFMVGDEGITFVFQEYQVAPYAAGSQRVTVPFDDLADILNPSYF